MTQSEALDILKTGANVFLTGEPGSGKTHTINTFVSYLREHGIEPAITASTGIAATHIGGMTIHSWSGIGIKKFLSDYDLDALASNKYVAPRISRAKVLIIDEVSMFSKNILDMVDAVCREVRRDEQPFGGLQVICVGDFFQLPPVSKGKEDGEGFAFESCVWNKLKMMVCYLSEQHRQDDEIFLQILSSIRKNTVTAEHHSHLKSRIGTGCILPKEITRLFPHNMDVDRINEEELAKIAGNEFAYDMSSKGGDAIVAALKKGCLSPERLVLKAGAIVMFTKNSREEGFMNGSLGTVEGFDNVGSPIVRLKNGKKIFVSPADWVIEDAGRVRASVTQLPLRLAWAITIHKSQGMSFDAAVMDLSNVFEYGQGYVALSRVRRLSGLFLLGTNEKTFEVHPEVFAKDAELRKSSEAAREKFAKISKEELQQMQDNFVRFCGGSKSKGRVKALKKSKVATHDITLQFWSEGKTIEQIKKERELTATTILGHLEKLVREKKVDKSEIMKICPAKLLPNLPKIHATMTKLGAFSLGPIFVHFKGLYSYEDLTFARILLE